MLHDAKSYESYEILLIKNLSKSSGDAPTYNN